MEEQPEEGCHTCPYCGFKTYQINDHYTHMEIMCEQAPQKEVENEEGDK